MKNFILSSGVVAALVFGCGKSSSSDARATGGSPSGGASANDAGDNGGPAATGGTTSTGGRAGSGGSAGPSSGGKAGGSSGSPSAGGTASGGDGSNAAGDSSGGSAEPAGAPGTGGIATTGGAVGTGGTSSGGAGGCGACSLLEECWDGRFCVAKSVALADFEIDATEVTRFQYAAWLATDPKPDEQRDECAWNTSFAPDATCTSRAASVCSGEACAAHPQTCIDFCDAAAYCAAIDKHLCGSLDGGALEPSEASDATRSEWHHACTSGGANLFVYGAALGIGKCNDATAGGATTVAVGTKSECQASGDYAGVFDLLGNVWEWEDNCQAGGGEADICNPRGNAFGMSAAAPNCGQQIPVERKNTADNVGFRCCGG